MIHPERLFKRLEKRGYEIKKLTRYQYRVECVLDLYPVHCRYHNIANDARGTWGDLTTDDQIAAFIDAQVAVADKILDEAIAKGEITPETDQFDVVTKTTQNYLKNHPLPKPWYTKYS